MAGTDQLDENVNVDSGDAGNSGDIVSLEEKQHSEWLNRFGKWIPRIFGFIGILCIILFIVGIVGFSATFWGIVLSCFALSILGTWSVYKYGSISEHIDRLKKENEKYEQEINSLSQTRQELGGQVNKLRDEVSNLQSDASELEKQAEEFNDLRKELESIAGDNKEIFDLVQKTNSIFDDMKQTVLENERAFLLNAFYQAAFAKDDDGKMNEQEYARFLAKLSHDQRHKFEALGSFKEIAGDDQLIDLSEFEQMIEKILNDVDELLKTSVSKA